MRKRVALLKVLMGLSLVCMGIALISWGITSPSSESSKYIRSTIEWPIWAVIGGMLSTIIGGSLALHHSLQA